MLTQTQSPRGGHAAPHRHPGRSCGSHLGAARAGGRGARRPRRFCGQKVVCQPGEAAELDAAGTTGRTPFPAASPASFPPAGSPVTERTGDSTQLGTWSPSWSWGPSRTFLEAQHRVFGAVSPLSPSHPLTVPRPLPPAPPPGRSSRLSCRRLLKLHVFHFSDVFDCTAVFFCFCVCVSWTLSPSGQRLCLILGRVPGAQLDGRPRGPCHACAERMTRRPTGQALRVSPASAFTQLPSVPYPGIGHRAAERRWGPRARVLRCAPRPPPPLFHPCPSDFPLRGPS